VRYSLTNSKSGPFIVVFLTLLILISITLGLGLTIGFILTSIFPSFDFGTATICGLLAIGITLWAVFQAMAALDKAKEVAADEEANEDEDDGSAVLSEEQVETVSQQLIEAIMMRVNFPEHRSRRSPGRSR